MEGQYIFKNLLIITNCLMLALATTRKSPRKFHRTMGRMHFEGENYEMVTNDLSLTGISFFSMRLFNPKNDIGKEITIYLEEPLQRYDLLLRGEIVNIIPFIEEEGSIELSRVSCKFVNCDEVRELVEPLLEKGMSSKYFEKTASKAKKTKAA